MSYESFEVSRIAPHLGAEIAGIDLTRPLGNHQITELHDALAEYEVLFFRDQKLDLESHKRLGRYFGELAIHPNTPGPAGHPELLPIHADANSKRVAGEHWHSDVSCTEEPPLGSILHLRTVPTVGGDTLFASATAAYDALSDRMKVYLDGLTALHSGDRNYRWNNKRDGIDDRGRIYPEAVHPVIRTHPVTKRKLIFVNETFTIRINELPENEGRALLEFLYEHSTKPDFQVRFRWHPESVAFWDNRSVQHLALWDYYPQVRSGFRVTIKGDRPH